MNRFDVGSHLWISRFSPKAFKEVVYVEGEWICSPEKYDIFQSPTRYEVVSAYAENENSKKWVLELALADSFEPHSTDAASLSGDVPSSMKVELNLNKVEGGVFVTYDDLIVTRKRSKNFQTLSRKLTKLQKQFQTERKYKDMGLVTHCLMEIKSLAQVEQMMDKHPEYFL